MIKARHHWFYTRFFDWYVRHMLKSDFSAVVIDGEWKAEASASLIIGNHISWWDGFWALYLNKLFLGKKLHVMMLEEQLQSRMFLNKAGAYSIRPGNRSVLTSLNYTREVLSCANHAVVMFPQGKLSSIYNQEIKFEKGIERIIRESKQAQLLFYVALIDYASTRRPSLNFYLRELPRTEYTLEELEQAYQQFFTSSIEKQKAKVC